MGISGVRILYAVTYITGKYKNEQPKGGNNYNFV